jgi:SHAQKYF class myb-like DNA-binding protein
LKDLDFNNPLDLRNEEELSGLLKEKTKSKKGRKKKAADCLEVDSSGAINDLDGKKFKKAKNDNFNTGRWKPEEHQRFIEAILKYGNEWKMVQKHVLTRSSTQARSHAQKFFVKIKKTNLLDFNIDLNKNSIKLLHEQANQMNSDQYLNTIKTLNNIAFEKKSAVRQKRRKSDLNNNPSALLDSIDLNKPLDLGANTSTQGNSNNILISNGQKIIKPNNIKILTISNEPENFYMITEDKNIIINNNINNINISFNNTAEKNMFLSKKRPRQGSIDTVYNHFDIFSSNNNKDLNQKFEDEFQSFFVDSYGYEKKNNDECFDDINFMDVFQSTNGEKNNFGMNFDFEEK